MAVNTHLTQMNLAKVLASAVVEIEGLNIPTLAKYALIYFNCDFKKGDKKHIATYRLKSR